MPRLANTPLEQLVSTRPVVMITGARQTGKSSLLQETFPDAEYVSFDHLNMVAAAQEAPDFFLRQFKDRVILDEIQYVPELFRELKVSVDEDRQHYGRWILTGSQHFEMMTQISESLAGRIGLIHLETLGSKELRESPAANVHDYIWKGGYPELWRNPTLDPADFFEGYLRTYVERDLKAIIEVKNLHDFQRFLRVTAGRVGQLVNYSDIANDVGVSDVTIRAWLHALQVSGIIYLLAPFHANIGKRLIKSPKFYFADHGLLCHLLGIHSEKEWQESMFKGNIWENIVLMELVKSERLRPNEHIFFYRDHNGVEIDFIVEKGQTLYLIEAKAGEVLNDSKLNFHKVAPLLEERFMVEKIVAQNISKPSVAQMKEYLAVNPLHGGIFSERLWQKDKEI